MIGKLLCFFGCHTYKYMRQSWFAHTKNPDYAMVPCVELWECKRCGEADWRWYPWAREAAKR